ncbi:MAG: winged helix-turn-helix transcriptional regulator [Solirubrobacteraceae bacterium]
MPTTRSYNDLCPIARALDVVGERWALLVVRELLLGPQRFSDLRLALPGVSSNLLTDRLRELEARGVICRRVLPPPAGSSVYELTDRGRRLEVVLDALGEWGATESPPADGSLSATAVLLFLRGSVRTNPAAPAGTFRLRLENRAWTLVRRDGVLEIEPGDAAAADAGIRTDPITLNALLFDPDGLDAAVATGIAEIDGDVDAVRRLLRAVAPRSS